jgi:3-methyladenine DNA glycosylase AlkD
MRAMKPRRAPAKPAAKSASRDAKAQARAAVSWLKSQGSRSVRDGMARYAIPSDGAYGVSMGAIQKYAKSLGKSHSLAEELWKTGQYESRMLVAYVAEPARLTAAQMDRWCKDFDNWAVCDTLCFALFDKTSLAWGRIAPWCRRKEEFVRRAGYALIASLAVHDKTSPDAKFARWLPLIEKGARDDRHFVKKGVSWALRTIGRRSPALRKSAIAAARRLARSEDAAPRWVGKDALRDLR